MKPGNVEAAGRAADDGRGRKPDEDQGWAAVQARLCPRAISPRRIMKTGNDGFQHTQTVVDGETRSLSRPMLGRSATDQGRLLPFLTKWTHLGVRRILYLQPEADLVELEERGIDGHVALGREGDRAAVDPANARRRIAWATSSRPRRVGGTMRSASGYRRRRRSRKRLASGAWPRCRVGGCLALNQAEQGLAAC